MTERTWNSCCRGLCICQLLLCVDVSFYVLFFYCIRFSIVYLPCLEQLQPRYAWRAERAYLACLVVRMARFFHNYIYIYLYGRTLFPDIRCLRITFDTRLSEQIENARQVYRLATNACIHLVTMVYLPVLKTDTQRR